MRKKTVIMSVIFTLLLFSVSFAIDSPVNLRIATETGNQETETDNTDNTEQESVADPYFDQNFEIARGASRTSGVAPLAVHFSAGFNPSSANDRGFHNYEYSWGFGDFSSGNWGTTGKSKNTAKGPVAAHVYETPGTYTASLTIKNASGAVVDTESFTITVTNPDEVFSGTNTTCISTDSDFTGCPAGARQVTTNDISQIANYVGAGSRVLLHRGSSWTSSGISMPSNTGPVSIGAYGAGTSRDAKTGICGNAPQITMTGGTFFNLNNKQNWRLSDLSFSGPSNLDLVTGGIDNQRILFLRIKAEGFSVAIGWSHWNNYADDLIDQMAVVECSVLNSNTNNMYVGSERLMLLGNVSKDPITSHNVRVWQAYLGVCSNNDLSGSSINSTSGRHVLKYTGPGYSTFAGVNEYCTPAPRTGCLEHRTQFNVISDNILGTAGPWPVSIGPQDTATDSYLSDIIFERNQYYADYGTKSAILTSIAIGLEAGYSTIRNNIVDGTGAGNDFTGVRIWQRGVEPAPAYNEVYNNTIYRSDTGVNSQCGISVEAAAAGTKVINNAISFPNSTYTTAINNSSSDLVQSNNVYSKDCGFTSPTNSSPLLRDFTPITGSLLDEAGSTDVTAFDDLSGVALRIRSDGYLDVGAIEN